MANKIQKTHLKKLVAFYRGDAITTWTFCGRPASETLMNLTDDKTKVDCTNCVLAFNKGPWVRPSRAKKCAYCGGKVDDQEDIKGKI